MKKIFSFFLAQLKYIFINPFWVNWPIQIINMMALVVMALVWIFYLTQFKNAIDMTPIIYASAVFVLNLFLASIVFQREPLISYILTGTGFFVQILFLIFLQFVLNSRSF